MSQLSTEQQPIHVFSEQAYLDYSMYVVLDRALPHIADGLKPVQRRIVYAMSELGLRHGAKYKKSARTVGDVLGKYHPHSDQACYEAMVLMAQSFAYRYPLIDGQGNWGSIDDPKSFAAMRYTESRLTPYTQVLLDELTQGTVDWQPNFDGSLKEPALLPARLPNLLLNGSSGIAVGMATDVPPHNLKEMVSGLVYLLDHGAEANLSGLLEHISGPDFPTGGTLFATKSMLYDLYESGRGQLKVRATYQQEGAELIITALPYQASVDKIMPQIAELMKQKSLPSVIDLQDQSTYEEPVRLVITLRSKRILAEDVMQFLFAKTDLERSVRINLNVIGLNRRPEVKGLLQLCQEWLTYREQTVIRRLTHRLEWVTERLHILAGLLVVHGHLDEVIHIIREAEDPKKELQERFDLSDRQVDAILEIKLRQLARVEQAHLLANQQALEKEASEIEGYLGSQKKRLKLIRKELLADERAFGDARRTLVCDEVLEQQGSSVAVQVNPEPITIVLSKNHWIRCAKGHDIDAEQLTFKSGDGLFSMTQGCLSTPFLLSTLKGRFYTLKPHELPNARGHGEPLAKHASGLKDGLSGVGFAMQDGHYILAQDSGYGLRIQPEHCLTRGAQGKQVLKVDATSSMLEPVYAKPEAAYLMAITVQGRVLVCELSAVPELKGGKGNKIIAIDGDDFEHKKDALAFLVPLSEQDQVDLYVGRRKLSLAPDQWKTWLGKRARRGVMLPSAFCKVKKVKVISNGA